MSVQSPQQLTPITEIPILKYGLPTRSLRSLRTDCDAFVRAQQIDTQQIERFTAQKATFSNTIDKIIGRLTDRGFVGRTLNTARTRISGVPLQKNNLDRVAAARIMQTYNTELSNLEAFSERLTRLKDAGYNIGELQEEFTKSLKLAQANRQSTADNLGICRQTHLPNTLSEPIRPERPTGLRRFLPFSKKRYIKDLSNYYTDRATYKQGMQNYNVQYNAYITANENLIDSMQNYAKNVSVSRNIKNAISADIAKIEHNNNLIRGASSNIEALKTHISEMANGLKTELRRKGLTGSVEDISRQLNDYFANPRGFLGGTRGAIKRFFDTTCRRPVIFKDAEFIRPALKKLFRR